MKTGVICFVLVSVACFPFDVRAAPETSLSADDETHGHRSMALGIALASLRAREGAERGHAFAVLLSGVNHSLWTRESLSFRSDNFAAIGGGSLGLASELDLSTALGFRFRLAENQGLVLRGGAEIWSAWSDWLALEAPQLELGYQALTADVWLDAGVRSALTVGFGHLVSPAPPGWAWALRPATGAYLRAGALGLTLSADAKLMRPHRDGSDLPWALVQAELCTAQIIGVCTRFMHMAADAHHPSGLVQVQSWNVVELVVGVGFHSDE